MKILDVLYEYATRKSDAMTFEQWPMMLPMIETADGRGGNQTPNECSDTINEGEQNQTKDIAHEQAEVHVSPR